MQQINPPDRPGEVMPQSYDDTPVTQLDGVGVRAAASMAAVDIRTLPQLDTWVALGKPLTDLPWVGPATAERILADLARFQRTLKYTEELRNGDR